MQYKFSLGDETSVLLLDSQAVKTSSNEFRVAVCKNLKGHVNKLERYFFTVSVPVTNCSRLTMISLPNNRAAYGTLPVL
jgi:hypothetical protein